jgi:hypothetical protein
LSGGIGATAPGREEEGAMTPDHREEDEIDLPGDIGQPARRALVANGYRRLEQLAGLREADLLKLHGVGPKAVERLGRALAARGQSFADAG